MLEYLVTPGRPKNVARLGPVFLLGVTPNLSCSPRSRCPVSSPDHLGLYEGSYGFVGARLRWAKRVFTDYGSHAAGDDARIWVAVSARDQTGSDRNSPARHCGIVAHCVELSAERDRARIGARAFAGPVDVQRPEGLWRSVRTRCGATVRLHAGRVDDVDAARGGANVDPVAATPLVRRGTIP
jgi:hypothetical protein